MPLFADVYRYFRSRAALLVSASVILILVSGFAATRFVVREDVTALMPDRPAGLSEQFTVLREAPFLQGLTITVGGPDPARAAASLADALRGPDIPEVFSGAGAGFSHRTLTKLCALAPGLMDGEQFAALPGRVTEDAVRRSLRQDARLLLTPRGLALRDLLALDPLGICSGVLHSLAPGTAGPRLESGNLVSPDGKHVMVLAEPAASVGDSRASSAVMERVRAAVRSLPEGTEVLVAGGHRHTEANAAVIRDDMVRILPVSLGCLALFFLVFIRSRRGMALFVLPAAALAVASACTGLFYGSLSGIVLGFGSVVLGITADYAIHVFFAVRSGRDVGESLTRVSRPLLLGAATTLAGFAAFFSSAIPCIVQMTVFAICGICAALFLALAVLPQCLLPGGGARFEPIRAPFFSPPAPRLAAVWGILAVCLAALLHTVPVNGDIRALSYTPAPIAADEARTREIWGTLRDAAMFAVKGDTLEAALEKNDALWRELAALPPGSGVAREAVTSLATILPSLATQAERHAAWTAYWRENGQDTLARLARIGAEAGFGKDAFAPFAEWISSTPDDILPETLSGLGLPLPPLFIREAGDSRYVYSLTPPGEPSRIFLQTLDRNGAVYVSGQTFRSALADATRDDMRRFGVVSLLAIVAMAALVLRSPRRLGLALLPVGAGVAAVLAVFKLCGLSLNIFHAMALPLVMALSVDYGVFMLARLEGTLDRESVKGVVLSGLTTLSGFGALLLARHPALFSLGLTVTIGLAASLATALFCLPRLASGPARAGGGGGCA
ncbi:MAG: MMPL family transporter [Deltaproteobacteria bacterium]|nr:MMPL family transporter [Deltaproteobacteria bacterium]